LVPVTLLQADSVGIDRVKIDRVKIDRVKIDRVKIDRVKIDLPVLRGVNLSAAFVLPLNLCA